jgi:hypothetical protein
MRYVRVLRLLAPMLAAIAAVSSCCGPENQEFLARISAVKVGQDEAAVVARLGPPTGIERGDPTGRDYQCNVASVSQMVYRGPCEGRFLGLVFLDEQKRVVCVRSLGPMHK